MDNEGEWIPEEEVEEGWVPPEEGDSASDRAFAAGAKVRGALGGAVGTVRSGLAGLFAPSEPTPVRAPKRLSLTPKGVVVTQSLTPGLVSVVPAPAETEEEDLSDLFEGPQPTDNDMVIDHLVDFTEEDEADLLEVDDEDVFGEGDMSDLTQVTRADIMGRKSKPRIRRISPPPQGLIGLQ